MATPKPISANIENSTFVQELEDNGESPYCAEYPLCRNVDDALGVFEIENMLDYQKVKYDWMLDGRKDDGYYATRSHDLLKMLNTPDIETEIELYRSRIEQRQLQFDCFVESVKEDAEESNHDSEEEKITLDDFGEFQQAEKSEDVDEPPGTTDNLQSPRSEHSAKSEQTNHNNKQFFEEKKECEKVNDVLFASEISNEKMRVPIEIQTNETSPEDDVVHDTDLFSDSDIDSDSTLSMDSSLHKINIETPEGRYLRRKRSLPNRHCPPSSLMLPQEFYEDTNEATICADIIQSLPWRHFPLFKHRGDVELKRVEHHLMSQLMQYDECLLEVSNQSLAQISQRKSSLDLCNQYLRDFDRNLSLADMKLCQSAESIRKAKGGDEEDCFAGLIGGCLLLEAWDQRTVYSDLDNLLLKCAELVDQEKQLQDMIDNFAKDTSQFPGIIDAAKVFSLSAQEDEQLSKVVALKGLRERADRVLDIFAEKVQLVLRCHVTKSCLSLRHFKREQYLNIFQAMICIEKEQSKDISTFPTTWVNFIRDSLRFEAEKCLARSLLDPTDATDSNQDKELLQLSCALQQTDGDCAKLKSIVNDLTVIRYGSESASNYFPFVFHRLCFLLTNVLRCHVLHEQWHATDRQDCGEQSKQAQILLFKSRISLLNHCEGILMSCLEGYSTFASKKKIFNNNSDDSPWKDDLEGIHAVLRLSHQFYSLGRKFVNENEEVTDLNTDGNKNSLRSTICTVMRKHLRLVHVETMNTMGISLSKESWQLVPMENLDDNTSQSLRSEIDFKAYLLDLIKPKFAVTSPPQKLWNNHLLWSQDDWFSKKDFGNPFELLQSVDESMEAKEDTFGNFDWTIFEIVDTEKSITTNTSIFDLIQSMIADSPNQDSRISIESCFKIYTKCLARLLLMMEKLPLIISDVTKVIKNVSDLYLTTVFRLCTRNQLNEKYSLGLEKPKLYSMESPEPKRKKSIKKNSGRTVGFGRSVHNNPGRPPQVISSTTESELSFPLPIEMDYVMPLQNFIERAQQDLEGMVKLDMVEGWLHDPDKISPEESEEEFLCNVCVALEKRQSAAWSSLLVAASLDLVKSLSIKTLKSEIFLQTSSLTETTENNTVLNDEVSSMISYVDSILNVVPRFIRISSRMACIRAIGARRIIEEVARCQWNTSRLSEASNRYVELVCGRYAFIWRFLCTSAKLPIGVRKKVWEQLVIVGYAALLEGFARVHDCTTEGRLLMSMDLESFAAGTTPQAIQESLHHDGIPQPGQVISPRGREYVDHYIKASYYPTEDVLSWIYSNKENYHFNHCLALTNGQTDLVGNVKSLYKVKGGESDSIQNDNTAEAEITQI